MFHKSQNINEDLDKKKLNSKKINQQLLHRRDEDLPVWGEFHDLRHLLSHLWPGGVSDNDNNAPLQLSVKGSWELPKPSVSLLCGIWHESGCEGADEGISYESQVLQAGESIMRLQRSAVGIASLQQEAQRHCSGGWHQCLWTDERVF